MRLREIKPGMVIHCKAMKEADILVRKLHGSDKWKDYWSHYAANTCYLIDENGLSSYGHRETYREYPIIEFSDLIIPDLTPAEVLKICNEMCREAGPCDNCKMNGNCFAERDQDYQKVVEICEQWKADHEKKEPEKKEPEVEWVDICRIIQMHDGGKKECVHEEDLSEHWKELTVEVILKDYITMHEGNYIAVIEHVCRVKK